MEVLQPNSFNFINCILLTQPDLGMAILISVIWIFQLIVIGIPSKTFNQEKENEKEIKEFCEVNFNINFPMTTITEVKGENSHEVFKWAEKNHGKSAIPKWNFHKILINKEGKIEETYNSFTKPMSKKITSKIESLL